MVSKKKQKYLKDCINNGKIIVKSKEHGPISKDDCIFVMQYLNKQKDEGRVLSRGYFRTNGMILESVWEDYFGTYPQFQKDAGIKPTRVQQKLHNQIARHSDADAYRELTKERRNWGENYKKPKGGRFKTALIAADFHDRECDAFALRVFLDTAKRLNDQLDLVCLAGDLFDLQEFGRFYTDPREWDVVGRMKLVHEKILTPLRKAVPDVEIDLIEGNHEFRLLKYLCNNSPEIIAVLSDLHGMGVREILGLDKFNVNYIGKGDLAAWKPSEEKVEVSRSFKIYWDSFLVHHEPIGKATAGMPGLNGHHHYHVVWHEYNVTRGPFEWHQLGGMHYRDASYCNGEKWSNGFVIVHVDTETKQVVFDYIDVKDFAVVGGKYYERMSGEVSIGK